MIARLLVSFGAAFAAVGFTILGMATSYVDNDNDMMGISYILMIGGIIATVIGVVWYRADERRATERLRVRVEQPSRSSRR